MSRSYWLEYGERIGDNLVHATRTVMHDTGPNEEQNVATTKGVLPLEALRVWNESEHVHDDGSLFLSALPDETREYLDDVFDTPEFEVGEHVQYRSDSMELEVRIYNVEYKVGWLYTVVIQSGQHLGTEIHAREWDLEEIDDSSRR